MKNKILKILSLALSIMLCFGIFAFTVSAESENPMTVEVVSAVGKAGDSVDVKINISNNPGVSSLKFDVKYDSKLTLTGIKFNSAYGSYVTAPTPYSNPQTISLISPFKDISVSDTLATLTFKISENAGENYKGYVKVVLDEDDIFDVDLNDVKATSVDGAVSLNAVSLISPIDNGKSSIDKTNKLVMSVPPKTTDLTKCFDCCGCKMNIVSNAVGNGTGSQVNIVFNGEIVDYYTLVVSGDVDGDGVCDVLDALFTEQLLNNKKDASIYQKYAANNSIDENVTVDTYQKVVNTALSNG